MLGASDSWWTIHQSHRPSIPASQLNLLQIDRFQNNIIESEEIDNFSLFEDICLRIPYLGEKILRHLDDKSLSNLKLSCKSICAFMQYQRWFWIRIIQRYIGKIEDVDETWQTAIDKGQLISLHIFPELFWRVPHRFVFNQ